MHISLGSWQISGKMNYHCRTLHFMPMLICKVKGLDSGGLGLPDHFYPNHNCVNAARKDEKNEYSDIFITCKMTTPK